MLGNLLEINIDVMTKDGMPCCERKSVDGFLVCRCHAAWTCPDVEEPQREFWEASS